VSVGSEWNNAAVTYGDVEKQSFDIWALIRRRAWLIVIVTLIGVALGALFYLRAEREYETSAAVQITKLRPETQVALATLEGYTGYENMSNHIIVIKSPVIVKQAITKFRLGELQSLRDVPPQHLASEIIGRLTSGKAGGREQLDSNVVQLNYRSRSVNDAMTVVKAMLRVYEDHLESHYKTLNQKTIDRTIAFGGELLKDVKQLNSEIASIESATRTEVRVGIQSNTTSAEDDWRKEHEEIRQLAGKIIEKSSLIESIERDRAANENVETLLGRIESAGALKRERPVDAKQMMEDMLLPKLMEQQQAREKFGPNHPRVREIDNQIVALTEYWEGRAQRFEANQQDQITPDQHLDRYLHIMKSELRQLEDTAVKLDAQHAKTDAFVKELAAEKDKLRMKMEERDHVKTLLDNVNEKIRQIDLVKNNEGFRFEVIQPAETAWQIYPMWWKVYSVAGFLGLVAGLGLAYLVDMADKSFRNPEEVRNELGVPILGHLPIIVPEAMRRKKGEPASTIGDMVFTHHKPKSTTSEAYRAVRTALNFGIRGEGHKVIQVTSPDPGDGKSTLAGNLAVCMAQSGKRVLLVDADFRRPRVHKLFGAEPLVGLSSIIKGTSDLADAVVASEVENLYLLPCGPRPANPSELLSSPRFSEMIHVLREQYDIVLIDTPPVLAVTDPCVVAPRVDGVVLLIRITKHVRPHAKRALESLESLGANLLGIVVNGVGGVRPGVGYGFGSQYGHRYAANSGYYDSYSYNYGAYHHYYDDEDEESPTEDQVDPRQIARRGSSDVG
jgi:capsular exopolysaccharide synthesis family protein